MKIVIDALKDSFSGSWENVVLGITISLLFIFLLYLLLRLLFWCLDFIWTKNHKGMGIVVDKEYKGPSTEMDLIMPIPILNSRRTTSFGLIPHQTTQGPTYTLYIQVENKKDTFNLSKKSYFKKIKVGDSLEVKYKIGRISKGIFIYAIEI